MDPFHLGVAQWSICLTKSHHLRHINLAAITGVLVVPAQNREGVTGLIEEFTQIGQGLFGVRKTCGSSNDGKLLGSLIQSKFGQQSPQQVGHLCACCAPL